jgi:hypothetical protein
MNPKKGPPESDPTSTTSRRQAAESAPSVPPAHPTRVCIDSGPGWAVYAWRWSS